MTSCVDDCLYYEVCSDFRGNICDKDLSRFIEYRMTSDGLCEHFKNKADVVEVKTVKAWLYKMAINNVGCVIDGDFSNACEEIIARLDGLRNFLKERSEGDSNL